jgi:hypothetical protein
MQPVWPTPEQKAQKNGAKKWRQKMAPKKWREISKVLAGKLKLSFIVGGKIYFDFLTRNIFFYICDLEKA